MMHKFLTSLSILRAPLARAEPVHRALPATTASLLRQFVSPVSILRTPAFRARLSTTARLPLSITARNLAEGDLGSPRSTGGPGDAFQRRERVNEDYSVIKREKEKLLDLKKRLTNQQAKLSELAGHINDLIKEKSDREDGDREESHKESDKEENGKESVGEESGKESGKKD